MKEAYDQGVNFFDNAEAYAEGNYEIIMGKFYHINTSWKELIQH